METERKIKAVEIPDGIDAGTMVYVIRFLGEKQSMHGTAFVRLQEVMEWAEEIWTNMNSRIMFDSLCMLGMIYATVDDEEKEVAAIHAIILQDGNSEFNPMEI